MTMSMLSGQWVHESRAQAGRGAEKTSLAVRVNMIFRPENFLMRRGRQGDQ